jgi:hypothetical protein
MYKNTSLVDILMPPQKLAPSEKLPRGRSGDNFVDNLRTAPSYAQFWWIT